jgi:hypothetical protein
LCLVEIVSVLWTDLRELSVLSKEEQQEGDVLGIKLPEQDVWMRAKVLSSEPLRYAHSLRHRVRLCLAGTDWASAIQLTSDAPAWSTTSDTSVATVVRKVLPMRLLNISPWGCLLETMSQPRVPAIGEMDLSFRARARHDLVRVCWTAAGSTQTSACHVGVEFVPVPTQRASIRQALNEIVEHDTRGPRLALVPRREPVDESPETGAASHEETWTACEYAAR